MMSKSISWGAVVLVFLTVFSGMSHGEEQTRVTAREVTERPQAISSGSSPGPNAMQAWSEQWHTFLWESFPAEWLQDSGKAALLEAYQENNWKPFFITGRFDVDPRGRLLLQRLERLQDDAIDPRPYQVEDLKYRLTKLEAMRGASQASYQGCLEVTAGSPDPAPPERRSQEPSAAETRVAAPSAGASIPGSSPGREKEGSCRELFREASALDIRLATSLIRFASEMNPFARDLQSKALVGQYPMDQFLRDLEPADPQYQVLVQAHRRYQQLLEEGHGQQGATVRDLQYRLQEEECYRGKITGHFDDATRQALQRCRARADLVAQAVTLYRQSETRRFQKFVRINIPQFTLEYRNEGKTKAVHRVIVGKAGGKKVKLNGRWVGENQTPILASTIEQVVFNPRWIVTDRIRQELSGAIAADPTFLSRHGYIENPSSRYRSGEPLLIQMPGPNNALGRVRFDFPNPYAVYMHDTPNRGLFQRTRRDFSHGCIRVDKASELARELLADDQNPAASKTDSFLKTNRETYLKLNEPIPIVIEYLPVVVNDKGELVFCGDPYGWFQEKTDRKS